MKRIVFCLCMLCLMLLPLAPALAGEIALYVSPAGSDEADGSEATPLRTIAAALLRVRAEKDAASAVVWLREGVYRFDEALQITHRDRIPLEIRASPGETPVITGDIPVTEWTETLLHGETVWAAPFSGKSLRAVYGEDGARQNARWPKEGFLHVWEPPYETSSMFENQRYFTGNTDELPQSLDGAFVRLLHWWKDELSGVRAYNATTGRITLNRYTSLTIRKDDRYWLENVLSVPLAAGEWAFDAESKLLYYAPLPGEALGDTALYAGMQERLITLDGAQDVTFAGIGFARTGWSIPLRDSETDFAQAAYDTSAAVYARASRNIRFEGCAFLDMGAGCIRLDDNVQDVAVVDCRFEDIGAHALYVSGRNVQDDAKGTQRITVDNNLIDGYGKNFLNAPAILLIHTRNVDILHNEIHDGTYTAISAGWVWGTGYNYTDYVRVENNLIYDIGQGMLADMGGVYTLGVQRNTVIRGNVIHDVHATEYGGWGVYLDEGASGILVENNLLYNCSSQGFHQHNGVTNTVRNNILAFSHEGQVGTSDKRFTGTFVLEGNLLVGEEPYFWRKYEKEKIDVRANLFFTGSTPFEWLEGGAFALKEDPTYAGVGFVPWENLAGRRDAGD